MTARTERERPQDPPNNTAPKDVAEDEEPEEAPES